MTLVRIMSSLTVVVKKALQYSNIFSTTVHAFMPQFRIWEHYDGKRYRPKETLILLDKRLI